MADRRRLPRTQRLHHPRGHQRAIRERRYLGREAVEKGNDAVWNGDDDDDGDARCWIVFDDEFPRVGRDTNPWI